MNRREFLAAAALMPRALQSLQSDGWRVFEITTHVHVQNASGVTRVWLPTPLVGAAYQQTLGDTYGVEHGRVVMVEGEDVDLLFAEWADGADPIAELTSRVATRPHAVDLTMPSVAPPPDLTSFARFLRPGRGPAADGAAIDVKKLAADATRGAGTDIEKARAIFDWTSARASVDRAALFVALSRAVGVPARSVYGIGAGGRDATNAQHARAEVYLVGFGWVPLDTAFGSWSGDWVAFNFAENVALPKTRHAALPYFMHPQAETANGFANSLDAASFRYEISVHEAS